MAKIIDQWLSPEKYVGLLGNDNTGDHLFLATLRSLNEWTALAAKIQPGDHSLQRRLAETLQDKQIKTAWFAEKKQPVCNSKLNLSEDGAIKSFNLITEGLSASDRAILEILSCYQSTQSSPRRMKIVIAEPASSLSLQIRGRFPYAIATGYKPENPQSLFPLRHLDLQNMDLPSNSIDVLITSEIFEHLPDYKSSISEVYRVLSDSGVYLFTCPFLWGSKSTIQKAEVGPNGNIVYLTEPEFHGDPLRKQGILVYQVPGWDILLEFLKAGFRDAAVCYLSSADAAIIGHHCSGCFVFVAQK